MDARVLSIVLACRCGVSFATMGRHYKITPGYVSYIYKKHKDLIPENLENYPALADYFKEGVYEVFLWDFQGRLPRILDHYHRPRLDNLGVVEVQKYFTRRTYNDFLSEEVQISS